MYYGRKNRKNKKKKQIKIILITSEKKITEERERNIPILLY